MASFEYTGRDQAGNSVSGVVTAADMGEARKMLRYKNHYVLSVREQAAQQGQARSGSGLRRKIPLDDMVVMSRQFATLIRAGLSILDCLTTIAEQTENALLAETLTQVRLDVMTGSTLAGAMRKHPRVFNPVYIALVQAGEAGGVLEATLETAAMQFNQQAELVEKVKAALTYPTLVIISAVGVVVFMLVFIVPVFSGIYKQFHAELPAVTRLLVLMSQVVLHYWWLVGAGMGGAVWATRQIITTPEGRRAWDGLKLKTPLMGKLARKIAIARFAQTFAGATRAGVPILSALQVSAETAGNRIIFDAVMQAAGFITEGATLSVPLAQTGQFPSMVTRMIAAGEHSGNLDAMLDEITRFYHRDIEHSVGKLTRLMEPLMTIVVGGIVLFILLALYMPVFYLTQVMHTK